MKTVLRRIAIVASGILLIMSVVSMIPRPGYSTPFLGMLILAAYATATGLSLLAIERPALDQRLRVPGVVANVVAIAFPIFVWAKLATGTLNLSTAAGLIPSVGFTLLAIALLWVLEAAKVFKPARNWAIATGVLTFASFAIMSAGSRRRYSGRDYADELEFLSMLASIAGLIYAATAAVWAVFLYKGLISKPAKAAVGSGQSASKGSSQPDPDSGEQKVHVEKPEADRSLELELKRYDVIAMDGQYEYMGLLYSTPEDAMAAAKRNRGET